MSTRLKIVAGASIAVAAAALTMYLMFQFASDDEERPPIIVRSGSIILEDGTPTNWKPWKPHGSNKQWQPDQPRGASVPQFSVSVANANGAAAPSSPCPVMALVGTKIAVEYTSDAGVKTQVVVSLTTSGSKREPLIDAPADLASNPGSGKTPPQLVYNPGAGSISNVIISDDAGNQQMCGFVKPASAVITIKPNR